MTARPSVPLALNWSAASDRGQRRSNNEDSWGAWLPGTAGPALPSGSVDLRDHGVLLAVSDGMGGAEGGEVASRFCIEELGRLLAEAKGPARPRELLPAWFQQIHRALTARAEAEPGLQGMGATLTALWLHPEGLATFCHVGDSRLYRRDAGAWRQVTEDQSVGAGMIRRGEMDEATVRRLRYRSMLEQVMGGDGAPLEPQAGEFACDVGAALMLCSDGLYGPLGGQLGGLLDQAFQLSDLATGTGNLVTAANAAGGPDNVTVILARLLPKSGV